MDIFASKQGEVLILVPTTRIDGSNSTEFETRLMELIEGRPPAVIIDFSSLDYISSAGLRVLLKAGKVLKAAGSSLVLCAMRPEILEVFQVSGFARLFAIHPDSATALAAIR